MLRRRVLAAGAAVLMGACLPAMAQNYRAEYRLSTVLGCFGKRAGCNRLQTASVTTEKAAIILF